MKANRRGRHAYTVAIFFSSNPSAAFGSKRNVLRMLGAHVSLIGQSTTNKHLTAVSDETDESHESEGYRQVGSVGVFHQLDGMPRGSLCSMLRLLTNSVPTTASDG